MGDVQHCTAPSNKDECDAVALGSLIQGLSKIGLWPRPRLASITISVNELSAQLKRLSFPICRGPEQRGYRGTFADNSDPVHGKCNISGRFRTEIDRILAEKPKCVMADVVRKHLEEQSKK